MSAVEIVIAVVESRVIERAAFFEIDEPALRRLASNARRRGQGPNDAILVAIDVDDPAWTELVDQLMPGYDWQLIRDRGEKPVARGAVAFDGLAEVLSIQVPTIAHALVVDVARVSYLVAVCAFGGASVFAVDPDPAN